MMSYRIFKMAAIQSEFYSGFRFNGGICLRSYKAIFVPNFAEISQSTAEMNYFPFRKTDGRHIGILFPVSI